MKFFLDAITLKTHIKGVIFVPVFKGAGVSTYGVSIHCLLIKYEAINGFIRTPSY